MVARRPADELLADLLRAHASIVTSVEELRRHGTPAHNRDAAAET
jgi:hypothetical protein